MSKHAELIKEYAIDWAESNEPWTKWEYRSRPESYSKWRKLVGHPIWSDELEYRRKPPVINFNGREIPAPINNTEGLDIDTKLWYVEVDPFNIPKIRVDFVLNNNIDESTATNGMFFLEESSARDLAVAFEF